MIAPSRNSAWMALVLVATGAAAEPLVADPVDDAPIRSVIVFEDRARIERRKQVALPAGVSLVRFEGLTSELVEPSVAARVDGAAVQVLGVRLEWQAHESEARAEVAQLRERLRSKLAEEARLERRDEVAAKIAALVGGYASALQTSLTERSAGDDPWTPEQTEAALNADRALAEWGLASADEIDANARARKKLAKERQGIEQNLERLATRRGLATRSAMVTIEATAPVTVTVALSYDVGGSGWTPLYEARLNEAAKSVAWSYRGQVSQATGEDWKDVQLTLSRARSSLGLAVPPLVPIRISGYVRDERAVGMVGRKLEAPAAAAPAAGEEAGEREAPDEDLSVARVEAGAAPVRFEIRTPVQIPSDGQPHQVAIQDLELAAALTFEAIPRLRPHVYRRARVTNTSVLPFLPGTVRVFREGAYVGDAALEAVAPGEDTQLYFGADGRLGAQRFEIARRAEDAGTFTSDRLVTIGYRFDTVNTLPAAVVIELVDALPVSEIDDVTVELTSRTLPLPAERHADGRLHWTLALAAGERKSVMLEYEVRFPRDVDLPPEWFE